MTSHTDAYHQALLRGFSFAQQLGVACGPVHFLVGIAEGKDLPPLREVVNTADKTSLGTGGTDGLGYALSLTTEAPLNRR